MMILEIFKDFVQNGWQSSDSQLYGSFASKPDWRFTERSTFAFSCWNGAGWLSFVLGFKRLQVCAFLKFGFWNPQEDSCNKFFLWVGVTRIKEAKPKLCEPVGYKGRTSRNQRLVIVQTPASQTNTLPLTTAWRQTASQKLDAEQLEPSRFQPERYKFSAPVRHDSYNREFLSFAQVKDFVVALLMGYIEWEISRKTFGKNPFKKLMHGSEIMIFWFLQDFC